MGRVSRALPSSDAKLLQCYYLSCEHQNSAGCFRLPEEYAAHDLQWDVERYREARAAVLQAGLVRYQRRGREIFYSPDDEHVEDLLKMSTEHVRHLDE